MPSDDARETLRGFWHFAPAGAWILLEAVADLVSLYAHKQGTAAEERYGQAMGYDQYDLREKQ